MRFSLLTAVGILLLQSVSANSPPDEWEQTQARLKVEYAKAYAMREPVLQYLKTKQAVLPPFGKYARPKPAPSKLMDAQHKALCIHRGNLLSGSIGIAEPYYDKEWRLIHSLAHNRFIASNGAEYAEITFHMYDKLDIDDGYPTLRPLYEHAEVKDAPAARQYRRIELHDELLIVVREPASLCTFRALFEHAKKQKSTTAREEAAQYITKHLISNLRELERLGYYYYYPKVEKISMVVDTKGRVRPKFEDLQCVSKFPGACTNIMDDAPVINMQQESVWTVGKLLHELYTGREQLFAGYYNKRHEWREYKPARIDYKPRVFRQVSDEGMEVLKGMLAVNARRRWTYKQILGSDWLQQ